MPEEELCDHSGCGNEIAWLLPHQYNTVEDLESQESDIEETIQRIYACITARTRTEMHIHLPELEEQVLSLLSDHSLSISILTNKLSEQHPLVRKHTLQHESLEDAVNDMIEMAGLVRSL